MHDVEFVQLIHPIIVILHKLQILTFKYDVELHSHKEVSSFNKKYVSLQVMHIVSLLQVSHPAID
jgi:hypothetical protein